MAFSRKAKPVTNIQPAQVQPEKVVIVTGPTFGTAMSFVLFGAVIGAAATLLCQSKMGGLNMSGGGSDAVLEGLSGGGAKETDAAAQLVNRLNKLSKRVKSLAGRVKETAHTAAEVVGPTLSEAVNQAKTAAQEAEKQLHEDLQKQPETPPPPPPTDPAV